MAQSVRKMQLSDKAYGCVDSDLSFYDDVNKQAQAVLAAICLMDVQDDQR